MKIPSKIRIAGVDYETEYVSDLNNGNQMCYGQCAFEERKIKLTSTIKVNHQHRCQTYLHEVLHAIKEHYNIDIGNADIENIVDGFATGLYQVLEDNKNELFSIPQYVDRLEVTK